MKVQKLLSLICLLALAIPTLVNAEIYKWKDKNGVVRYSDMPPPPDIKADRFGKKSVPKKEMRAEPTGSPKTTVSPSAAADVKKSAEEAVNPEVKAARLRARNAEIEKKNKQEKEAQAKLDAENCIAAKSNYQTFAQGGRVYKTSENGERQYMSDDDLTSGKQKAQAEINRYCK